MTKPSLSSITVVASAAIFAQRQFEIRNVELLFRNRTLASLFFRLVRPHLVLIAPYKSRAGPAIKQFIHDSINGRPRSRVHI